MKFILILSALLAALTPARADSAVAAPAGFQPGTLAWHLSTNAAGRARGLAGGFGDLSEVSGWHYAVYSGTNLARLTNAVWSGRFWLKGVRGLSATSIGASNGMAAQGMATLVSPRHFLCATHMHPEAFRLAFLDTNNVLHWRTSLQRADVGNDTSVGILNEDLPPSVGWLPVLPENYPNYLPATGPDMVQGLGMNQNLCVFSEPMSLGKPMVFWDSRSVAPFGLSTNWAVTLGGGDSSNPAMLLIGDQLVLVAHNTFVNGGPDYARQIAAINRQMHFLSTNNAAGTDYQLTQFPLTNWPALH